MATSLVAVITVVALGAWHSRTRRRPSWSTCQDGRFYITLGYPAVVIAVYWLTNSSAIGGLEWALGSLWALAATTSFVCGFNKLNADHERRALSYLDIESIPDSETFIEASNAIVLHDL